MRFTAKHGVVFFGMAAAALAFDNFRLRITCRALERVVNYAVGGIHLDGVGGVYDPDDEIASDIQERFESEPCAGDGGEFEDVGPPENA